MNPQQLQQLIEKYLNGTCSEAEKKIVEAWYASFDKNEAYTASLNHSEKKQLEEKLLARINNLIVTDTGKPIRKTPPWRLIYPIAATLGIAIIGVIAILLLNRPRFIEYQTDYGETREITLPDSSTIILNGHSGIRFAPTWNPQTDREIWLEGEAYFSVTHQANHQHFVVHTDNMEIEVLGTEFNVNTRNATTRVVLNKGKVKLNIGPLADTDEVVMIPGELVEFSEKEQKLTKKTVDVEVYTSWKNHELIFQETSLEEIGRILEDTYGLNVEIDRALLSEKFSGRFASDKVSVLLTAISEVHKAQITRNGQTISINKK